MALSAVTLVQEFYLPMPEAQVYQAESAIQTGISSTQASIYAIVVTGNGTQIYYDQWEDGYEINLASPAQSSTLVWGDGNDANGVPPGFAHDPAGLTAGTVITLTNNVTLPRNPSVLLYDARDRVAANKALAITRAGWPVTPGSVFAGAVSVLSTLDYGMSYISPVGQDLTNKLFQYVGLFVMAAQDGTVVTIDTDGATGTNAPFSITLNRGESYLVNGGIKKGASVAASKIVQADLMIGHVAGSYAADWFTLYPVEQWSASYYTPVCSAASGSQPTYVYLYNPNTNAITISYNTRVGSGSFSVPASNGVFQYQMPIGSGASFTSTGGAHFYALSTVSANNTADTAYNWGFTLLPADALTTEASVGWGPGSSDGTVNGSPVWVTPVANTTVFVDYNGDHNGPYTTNGLKYDTNYTVAALESKKIFDPDKDQTAMRLFTVDGTLISAAWGQDPGTAAPGNPYIDAGTVVIPFPVPTLTKTLTLYTDVAPTGLSTNDVIEYTVSLDNKGLLPLGNTVVIDAPSTNLTYVTNTTTLDGNALADDLIGTTRFPLDESGYTIPVILRNGNSTFKYRYRVNSAGVVSNSVNVGGTTLVAQTTIAPLPPGGTNQCAINFTGSGGAAQTSYAGGANVYVTVTDNDVNTSTNTIQTTTVVVRNNARNDLETITLTETGTNTGIFRNTGALPTSLSAGLSQQDGTLYIAAGDTLTVTNVDALFGDTCNASATIQTPANGKVLYLSSPGQSLDRVDPVATGDGSLASSIDIGSGGGGSGVVTVDATSKTNSASASSITWSHATGAGANRLLLVGVATGSTTSTGNDATTISSVTYGGTALTALGTITDQATPRIRSSIYVMTNPPSGAANVVVTLAAARPVYAGATTFTGVNQTNSLGAYTSFGAANGSTGFNSGGLTNIPSAVGELVYDTIAVDGETTAGLTLSAGAGQTILWTTNQSTFLEGASSTKAGAALVTNIWNWSPVEGQQFAVGAVSIKPAAGGGAGGPATNLTSFAQTPAFATSFIISSNSTIAITNYITLTNGSLSATPAVTATLRYGTTNILVIANPTYNSTNSTLVWQGTLTSNLTIPAGQLITYDISNGVPSTAFHVDYDVTNKPSKIILPTGTVIGISSFAVYDAPYPGGSLVTTPVVGSTLYVRAVVTDPFGNSDISSVKFAITAPSPAANVTVTNTVPVATTSTNATYEYVWSTSSTSGGYSIAATANEGTEGITATAATSLTLIVLDLGTPSSGSFASNNYPANATVCLTVTDLDQNLTNAAVETVTAIVTSNPGGDSQTVTLTETGTNTGVFSYCSLVTSTNIAALANTNQLYAPVGAILTLTYTDPNDPGDVTTATTTIVPPPGTPGIGVTKSLITPANGQALVGDTVQFNLQIANTGSTTLTNIQLTDTFTAARFTFVSASLAPSSTTATSLTWNNLGSLLVGELTNLTVTFTATNSGAATNRATANSGTTTNFGTVTLTNTRPALTVTKTLLSPTNSPVSISSNVVFRIVVRNTGDTAIPTLPLEDTFSSAYLAYVTNSATIPPDGSGAGSLFWANLVGTNSLAVGASLTNDLTMLVVGAGNPAQNLASVDYAVDANGKPVPPTSSLNTNLITAAATISGHVYNDTNQSGTLDLGEAGLADVSLSLYTDPNGDGNPADGALVQLVTSDANGRYELLNLALGKYVVVETDPAGYSSSSPVNNRRALNLTNFVSSAANTNVNFFDYQPAPVTYGNILGTVYYDANGNGTNNAGETGLANVNLDLVQDVNTNGLADLGEPVVASATSDTNGNYTFPAVTMGNYVVRETDLNGYYSTGDSLPPNDNQIGLTITASLTTTNNSFYDRPQPLAVNDTNSTPRNVPLTFNPLLNDTNYNGDTLVITNALTTNGTVIISNGTNLVFTPTNLGVTTITYTISDGHGGSSTATITVTVTNLPPVAVNDSTNTLQNVPVTIAPLGNDSDPNGDPITITGVSPTNGTISSLTTTNCIFTPATNFIGTATIGYTISDGNGGTSNAVITVTVRGLPVANNDSASTPKNVAVTIAPLGNDTDPNPSAITIASVSPTNGTISAFTGTNFIFTPNTNFTGSATIGYTITNIYGGSATALITVTVTNRPPVANNDSASGTNSVAQTIAPLGNDSDPDGDALTITAATSTNGIVVINPGSTNLTFTPTNNGAAIISYTISDGSATSSALVTVTVTNPPPVAVNDTVSTAINVPVTIAPLGNDSDPNGGTLSITVVNPTNGTISSLTTTNFIFTPTTNFVGDATIGYTISDGQGGTASALITVHVTPLADLAVTKTGPTNVFAGTNFTYTITVTNLGAATASSVTVTDSLPASVIFVSAIPAATTNGSNVVWTNLGNLAANGSTNLTLTVTAPANGASLTNFASVGSPTTDPNPTNNTTPPVVTGVTPVANLSITKAGPAGAVLPGANYDYTLVVSNAGPSIASSVTVTDALPANVTFASATGGGVTNGGNIVWLNVGSLAAGATTNFTLTVTAPLTGSVTNTASTGSPTSDPNPTNNFTPPVITGVSNVPPVAVNDSYAATEDTLLTVPAISGVLTNDSDANGDPLTIVLVATTTNGVLTLNTNTGGFTYLPATNFFGTDTFTYRVNDGVNNSGVATVTINVSPVNDAPIAYSQTLTNGEDLPLSITLTGSDVDGPTTNFTVLTQPANGTVTGGGPGVTFQPDTNWFGTTSFTFSVCDG
ncbi:MAG: Ig-like domain-containing protein, partial [Verrucomicrobia bacterium]|nr:Ig-like domain-containing protein [Verrucomicrobiota bacterium]